eukprot:5136836-Pyramimonas_sp.AAC.1
MKPLPDTRTADIATQPREDRTGPRKGNIFQGWEFEATNAWLNVASGLTTRQTYVAAPQGGP